MLSVLHNKLVLYCCGKNKQTNNKTTTRFPEVLESSIQLVTAWKCSVNQTGPEYFTGSHGKRSEYMLIFRK